MLNLISKLFASGTRVAAQPQATVTSGDLITQCAGGSNLVDGLPTWHYAESKKNDLQFMLRCCEAEMLTMQKADFVAAPYSRQESPWFSAMPSAITLLSVE